MKSTIMPRISGECEIHGREAKDRSSSYLEEVRNIRIDLVDEANTIAKYGRSFGRVQSGLEKLAW